MVLQRLKPHREQQLLLAACTTRTAPAPHLSRRRDRDRPVGFADVAAIEDPEWSRADRTVPRFSVAGLVPGGQAALASVPLPKRVLDDIDTVTADVASTLAARPELLHQHAVLMHLAPVVAWLKEPEPLADWERELLALPEESLTQDAEDAWFAEQASRDARAAVWSDAMFDDAESGS